jgi:hypothetical protein
LNVIQFTQEVFGRLAAHERSREEDVTTSMISYDKQFLIDSVALLQHRRVSHMGAHQFALHGAMRGRFPMSGALGWQRYKNDCPSYYILQCEKSLMKQVVAELPEFLDQGTPLINLGTGTLEAVRSKSLPIARASIARPMSPSTPASHSAAKRAG